MHSQAQHKRKYLSTSEMVTGYRKKTNDPIPHISIPGDYRVYRPTKHDVLCGRGKPIQDHIGNLRMRNIIASNAHRYFHARKHKKQQIVEEVVELVKCSGGVQARFLKRVGRENYWVEVPNSVACDKVSHGLRCFVRKSELSEFPESQDYEEQSHPGVGGDGDDSTSNHVRSSSPASSSALQDSASAEDFASNPSDSLISKLIAHRMEMARLAASGSSSEQLPPSLSAASFLTTTGVAAPSYIASGGTASAFLPALAMSRGIPPGPSVVSSAQLVELLARERLAELPRHTLRESGVADASQQDHQLRIQELIKQAALKQQGTNEMLVSQIFQQQQQQQQRQEDAQKVTLAFLLAAAMGGGGGGVR